MARLIPLTITAYLQQGVALDTIFGTALDGLLASAIRDTQKATRTHQTGQLVTGSLLDGGLANPTPTTIDLPLGRCQLPTPDDWHWMCTTALPVDHTHQPINDDPDVHFQTSRVRERLLPDTVSRIPAALPPASGRYRLRRIPIVTTPAHAIIWRAVGDPEPIEALLTGIASIGRRRSTGEGTVLRWNIQPDPTADPNAYGHLHHTGQLGRPTPLDCLPALNLSADRTGTAGLRPPYWHPATQRQLALPAPLQGQPHAPAS